MVHVNSGIGTTLNIRSTGRPKNASGFGIALNVRFGIPYRVQLDPPERYKTCGAWLRDWAFERN